MIYTVEKTLKDVGDKVKPEDKTMVEEKVKALKDILETGSKEDLEKATGELSEAAQKVGAAAYASAGSAPGQQDQPSAGQA
ncbi:MAG: Chaperone protein DnaK, partial [Microgenomates group bacterium GW2011_GWA2_47_8]